MNDHMWKMGAAPKEEPRGSAFWGAGTKEERFAKMLSVVNKTIESFEKEKGLFMMVVGQHPCPFCGNMLTETRFGSDGEIAYHCTKPRCNFSGFGFNAEDHEDEDKDNDVGLKPCPHCGMNTLRKWPDGYVLCENCGWSNPHEHEYTEEEED